MNCTVEISHGTIVNELYDAILKQRSVQNVKVAKSVVVQGKTAAYPVDILWEFTDGYLNYKSVIQAKDWDKAVNNAELFKFLSLLRDISGQITGVFFTRPVYDKDIKKIAEDAGITLYELRAAEQGCWYPIIDNVDINVDALWAKNEKRRLGLENEAIQISGDSQSFFIYAENGRCRESVNSILKRYADDCQNWRNKKLHIVHEFSEPSFLQTDNERFPLVKLDNIAFDLEVCDMFQLNSEEIVDKVLDNIGRFYSR